jgi:hypothetical protein
VPPHNIRAVESDDSADATPAPFMVAKPTPSATASAPMRPTYLACGHNASE